MPEPVPQRSAASTLAFLSTLYGDCELSPSAALPIWFTQARPGQQDRRYPVDWHTDLEAAAFAIRALPASRSIYFGVCLHHREAVEAAVRRRNEGEAEHVFNRRLEYSRGFAETVSVIPALWLDIDYGDEGHDQGNLPPTREGAQQILDLLPFRPSLVVDTGGGFHAYWILREPWEIRDEPERQRAIDIIYGWNQHAKQAALANLGWAVDSTGDLARVLRPAGTFNTKHEGHVVAVLRESERRYNPSDFEPYAVTPQQRATARPLPPGALNAGASAPAELLEVMLELDAGFEQTWNRRRQGQFGDDASRYEQALATRALQSGWIEADVIALLIQFRREKFNEGPKHAGYYSQTIATARGDAASADAFERVDEITRRVDPPAPLSVESASQAAPAPTPAPPTPSATPTPTPAAPSQPPPVSAPAGATIEGAARVELFENVSRALQGSYPGRLEISSLIEYAPGTYHADQVYAVVLNGEEVRLGPIDALLTYRVFRSKVLANTHVLTAGLKQVQWERLLRGMLSAIEQRADAERGEEVQGVVLDMLRSSRVIWHDGIAHPSRMVSYYDPTGKVLLSLPQLRQWMQSNGDRMTPQALALELRAAGSENTRRWFHFLDDDGARQQVQLRLWTAPWVDRILPVAPRPDEVQPDGDAAEPSTPSASSPGPQTASSL